MAKKYELIDSILGYFTKPDKTDAPFNALVAGSQNVIINDNEKVSSRAGYSLFGAVKTSGEPIESSYDWQTSSDSVINIRSHDDELEVCQS